MIRIKTIAQVINTYEVDELIQADFLREMARGKPSIKNHQTDKISLDEIIIDIQRLPEPDSSEPASEDSSLSVGSGSPQSTRNTR